MLSLVVGCVCVCVFFFNLFFYVLVTNNGFSFKSDGTTLYSYRLDLGLKNKTNCFKSFN